MCKPITVYNIRRNSIFYRKCGGNLNSREEFVFWRLAYFFISDHGYRIVQLFENQKELWLEKLENKKAPIVRLLLQDIDWSNSMQRDIELTAANGERIRRQIGRREINVVNVYISEFPPVDEYEYRLEKPYIFPEGNKTSVSSFLLAKGIYESGFESLSNRLEREVFFPIESEPKVQDVESIKKEALEHAMIKARSERAILANGKPFFTYIFMIIQIAVFFWLEMHGGSTNNFTLIKYGAKFNPLIYNGEWWRFITPIFLHIGFLHLATNTLALYFLGEAVERIYGNIRFPFIYLFAGIIGVIASFLFSPNISAGASGAIFGCLGALLYFGVIYPKLFFRTIGINLIVILIVNLVFDFSATGIDNAGHLGGLAGGFLAAGMVHFPKQKKPLLQLLFFVLSVSILWGSLFYGFSSTVRSQDESSNLLLAEDYIKQSNYEQAYNVLNNYLKKANHPSEKVYFLLSFAEIKKGLFPDAKTHLQKAIQLDPNFDEAYYNLAIIYLNEKNIANAKINAEKAAELKPNEKRYSDLVSRINQNL